MTKELLRAAAGVGIFLILLVGIALWSARPAAQLPGWLAAEQTGSSTDEPFVGDIIVPPKPAPDFELTDYSGTRVGLKGLSGQLVLLSFAYTSCPDVCPLLSQRFVEVQKEFGAAIGRDIALVFITVDPEGDTSQRRAAFTQAQGGQWYFLSGELAQLEKVWKDYRIYVKKEGVFVEHSTITYLIDKNGLIRLRYGGVPPSKAFIADIKALLGE